jgi:hypothetical protein
MGPSIIASPEIEMGRQDDKAQQAALGWIETQVFENGTS